ncbi:MAG: carboxylating nicotinate-nucleotide diphosphorylase [Candidatus Krumholzibacteriota bacterium]|nr:carboxylating nicotinate-nucleotide diphosphorylase [Candidatus Krumholzibacteriota bacterium]
MKKGTLIDLIRTALDEDDVNNDITTGILVDSDTCGSAEIIAKGEGVISGQECAGCVFSFVDDSLIYSPRVEDGARVRKGDIVAVVEGSFSSILNSERLALNFLGHLSGVATVTASFSQKVKGSGIRILDTRKTTPGLRFVEKKAVRDGGGENHRSNLSEMVLVKENHISIAGGLVNILDLLGKERLKKAEIEVGSLDELSLLIKNPPARIMLDNFTPDMVERAVEEVEKCRGERPEIEVSGGISLDTVDDYVIPGVNYISVGSITSSAPALDLSLIIGETVV